jgi:hypothetical protein
MYTLANNLEDARLFICITWVGRLLTGFLLHQINSITAEKTSATNGRGSTFLMSPIGAQKAIFLGKVGEQPYVEQPNVYAVMYHIQSNLEVRLPLFSVNTNNSDIYL